MSEGNSSPVSTPDSIGCTASILSLNDPKSTVRHTWYNHIVSPRLQPIASKIVTVLTRNLPAPALLTLSDTVLEQLVNQLVSVMHWDDDGTELHDLQQQVEVLLKQAGESDDKSITIARLTGLVAAKEEEVERLHQSWDEMNDSLRSKETQRREKEVQLIAMQAELNTANEKLKEKSATIQELRSALVKMEQSKSTEAAKPPPCLRPLSRLKVDTLTSSALLCGPKKHLKLTACELRCASDELEEIDEVRTLTEQLELAEEERSRCSQLTEKYRQLAFSKDKELCAQNKWMEAELHSLHQKYQRQLQELREQQNRKIAEMTVELEQCQRSFAQFKSHTTPALPKDRLPPQQSPLMAAVPEWEQLFSRPKVGQPQPHDAPSAPPAGPSMPSPLARAPTPPRHPTHSSEGSPASVFGSMDFLDVRPSYVGGDAVSSALNSRPVSRSTSIAFSLSSMSSSGSEMTSKSMQDASTQVDTAEPEPCLSAFIGDPEKTTPRRRASGPVLGYRGRSLTDCSAVLKRAPPPPLTSEPVLLSPRSRALAAVTKLSLHKLHDKEEKPEGKAQGTPSAVRTKAKGARTSASRSSSSTDPLSARSAPATPACAAPRQNGATSINVSPFKRGHGGGRAGSLCSPLRRGHTDKHFDKHPDKHPSATPGRRGGHSAAAHVADGPPKSVVVLFPHPLEATAATPGSPRTADRAVNRFVALEGHPEKVYRSTSQPLSSSESRPSPRFNKAYF